MDLYTMSLQPDIDENNKKDCIVCQTPQVLSLEDDGQIFYFHGKEHYVCSEHCDAFTMGMGMGRLELNNQVIQSLCNLEDKATGWDVKKAIYDIVPLSKRQILEQKHTKQIQIYNPREICQNLNLHVVGQQDAKTRISLSVFEHIKQIRDNEKNISPDKHNVLLIGPSGCGKTLLARTVAKYLELPFTLADSTGFSPTGFQGADVDTTIAALLEKSKYIPAAAEKGFVFFDEIDKLGTYNNSKGDMLNMNTQNTLLRLIEGKKVKVLLNASGDSLNVSTDKILFFFGGAFPGLIDIIAKLEGYNTKPMGFRNQQKQSIEEAKKTYDILSNASLDIMTQALIEYGLSAELVGRIPIIVPLAPLTKEQLFEFLLEKEHSPLLRQKHLFEESGYELNFTDDFIEALVENSYQMVTGVRALTSAVKTSVSKAAFDMLIGPIRKKNGSIIINKECLKNPESYVVVPKSSKPYTLKADILI